MPDLPLAHSPAFAFDTALPTGWRVRYLDRTLRLLAASLIPNLPVLAVREFLHLKSGVVNLDYFLLSLIACEVSPLVASALFVFVYALEMVRLLDTIFYFSQRDLLYSSRFLTYVHPTQVLLWGGTVVFLCAVSLAVWKGLLPKARGRTLAVAALPIAALLSVLFFTDFARGLALTGPFRHAKLQDHAVDEVLLRIPISVDRTTTVSASSVLDSSASLPLWGSGSPIRQKRENVLLVLVESMGLLTDKGGRSSEFAMFQDPALTVRYNVTQGTVPFTGSTVVGEMRELCLLRTGAYIAADMLEHNRPCLPRQFREAGYQTVAFHGYRSTMFQRNDLYPKLGFQEEMFLEQMKDLPTCSGAFFGACDEAVARKIKGRMEAGTAAGAPPQFIYWLTLNSHLPVADGIVPPADCPINADQRVCTQLWYVEKVLRSVKEVALDPSIVRTTILLVGDHAPPFLKAADREHFDEHMVPFVELTPR